jgi:hypothetical protein
MNIFHVGLPKTGTMSLTKSLRMLGFSVEQYPWDQRTVDQLKMGDYKLDLLNKTDAITDLPSSCFYKEFDREFPGSKFILTIRDKNQWMDSCKRWWDRIGCNSIAGINRLDSRLNGSVTFLKAAMFGSIAFNTHRYSSVYDRWEPEARDYFSNRPNDFLVMDITSGDGWEKLCPFLGVDIPSEPFPWENKG